MTEQDQTPPQDDDTEGHFRYSRAPERKDDDETTGHVRPPAPGGDDDTEGHRYS